MPVLENELRAKILRHKKQLEFYAINKNFTDRQWRYALNQLKEATTMLAELTDNLNDKEEAIKINSLSLKDIIKNFKEETVIKSLTTTSENNIDISFDIGIIEIFKECKVTLKEENEEQKVVFSFKK